MSRNNNLKFPDYSVKKNRSVKVEEVHRNRVVVVEVDPVVEVVNQILVIHPCRMVVD